MGSFVKGDIVLPGAILVDTDGDGLPDRVRALLVLGAAAALPEQCAAVDLAARLGFETLALHLPLAVSDPDALPEDRVPLFIGRPGTLSSLCPVRARRLASGSCAG